MQFPFVSKQFENLMRINCRVYILKHSGKHNQKTTQSNLLIDISSKASVYIFFSLSKCQFTCLYNTICGCSSQIIMQVKGNFLSLSALHLEHFVDDKNSHSCSCIHWYSMIYSFVSLELSSKKKTGRSHLLKCAWVQHVQPLH